MLHSGFRLASTWRSRCEAIVDALFGFELRREEIDYLNRRSPKR
jgi:NAD(P)H-hydrate repair Nnr-like enzyme with NAD(P)H-hydrate epimerase domain